MLLACRSIILTVLALLAHICCGRIAIPTSTASPPVTTQLNTSNSNSSTPNFEALPAAQSSHTGDSHNNHLGHSSLHTTITRAVSCWPAHPSSAAWIAWQRSIDASVPAPSCSCNNSDAGVVKTVEGSTSYATKTVLTSIFSQSITSTVIQTTVPSYAICQLTTSEVTMSKLSDAPITETSTAANSTATSQAKYIHLMWIRSKTMESEGNNYNNSWLIVPYGIDVVKTNTEECYNFHNNIAKWKDLRQPPLTALAGQNISFPSDNAILLNATINGYKDCHYERPGSYDDGVGMLVCADGDYNRDCEHDTEPKYECPSDASVSDDLDVAWFPRAKCQYG